MRICPLLSLLLAYSNSCFGQEKAQPSPGEAEQNSTEPDNRKKDPKSSKQTAPTPLADSVKPFNASDKTSPQAESDKRETSVNVTAIPTLSIDPVKDWMDRTLRGATIVLFFVAVYQMVLIKRSVDAADASAKAAKVSADALIASERAWVVLEELPDGPRKAMFCFKNYGKTPAWPIEMQFIMKTSETDRIPIHYGDIVIKPCNDLVIDPGDTTSVYSEMLNGTSFPEDNLSRLGKGSLFLHFFGIYRYKDITGTTRETKCCYIDRGNGWQRYGRDQDNECT